MTDAVELCLRTIVFLLSLRKVSRSRMMRIKQVESGSGHG